MELEQLYVKISADINELKVGLKGAQSAVKSAGAGMQSALRKNMAVWAKWAIAAAGAYKAVSAVMQQFSIIDDLAKQSDALNMNIKTYVAMQYAGKLAGVSTDQLRTSMLYMTKSIGEAQRGAGEYVDSLAELGLKSEDLIHLEIGEQFARVSEGISQLNTSAEQAAVVMRIFGRSGMRTMNLIQQGAGAIQSAKERTEEWGTALMRVDARLIEDVNDALVDLKEIWIGKVRRAIVDMAPTIVGAIHSMAQTTNVFSLAVHGATWAVAKLSQGLYHFAGTATVSAVRGLNTLFEGVNKLTGLARGGQVGSLQDMFRTVFGGIDFAGLPHIKLFDADAMEANYEKYRATASATAEHAAKDIEKIIQQMVKLDEHFKSTMRGTEREGETRPGGVGMGGGASAARTMTEQIAERLKIEEQLIKDAMSAEEAAIYESYLTRIAMYDEALAAEALSEDEWRSRSQKAWAQHNRSVVAMRMQAGNQIINIMRDLVAAAETSSREEFEWAKALSIGEAVVNTASAITKAMPNWGQVALVAATGAAQIAKISSQQFQGGASALSATGPEQSAATAAAGGGGRDQNVNIVISGVSADQFVSGGNLRDLIEQINEVTNDGTRLTVQ